MIDSTFIVFVHSLLAYFWVGLPEELRQNSEFLNFHLRYILDNVSDFARMGGVALCFLTVQWLYHAFLESSARQATIGKLAVDLKVTDLKGKKISFWRASGRYFAKFFSLLPLGAGFMMVFSRRRRQGLHDLLSGCLVLRR